MLKKAYTDVTVNSGNTLGAFEGSAAKDTLTISGNIAKSINTGDGADEVTLGAAAKVYEKATISLGGGDDTLTISTNDIGLKDADGAAIDDVKASVTIDGGAGTKDKLVLNSDISAGVKAITGVEFIDSTLGAISSAVADGLKTSVEGTLTVKADYTNTKTIDLRGIKAVKNDAKQDQGSLSLSGITYENITLSSNIKENIVVTAHKADSKKSYAEINKFAADDRISVGTLAAKAKSTSDKNLDLTNYNDVKTLLSGETGAVAINDAAGKKSYIWQIDDLTTPKLVAIVDKKLKVDGVTNSFAYDDGKTPPEEQGNTSTISYVSGSTTLDINKGRYGAGSDTQPFKAPAKANDVLEVELKKDNGTAPGTLKVTDSGDNKGTVKVYVMDGATGSSDIDFTAVKNPKEIYLGNKNGATVDLDASKYTFKGVETVTATTSGDLKVAVNSLGTGASTKAQLDLTKVDANVTISGDVTAGINLNNLIKVGEDATAAAKDTITLTTKISGGESITLTNATENITIAEVEKSADLTTMLSGAATNDSVLLQIGAVSASSQSFKLSAASDTVKFTGAATTANKYTITEFNTGDKAANVKALVTGVTATEYETVTQGATTASKALGNHEAYFVDLGTTTLDITKIFADGKPAGGATAVLVAKSNTDVKIYVVTDASATGVDGLKADPLVTLTGTATTGVSAQTVDDIFALA